MKALWRLLAMAIPLQPISSQEVHYAPTVEQCRADQQWLMSKLKPSKLEDSNISYKELHSWTKEMLECLKVDPENEVRYYSTVREASMVQINRLETFLCRHSLYAQFIAEDHQGAAKLRRAKR